MIVAAFIEIGPNVVALFTPIATAFVAWVSTRTLRREMKPNGGSSMRDALDRIERRLDQAGIPPDATDRRARPRKEPDAWQPPPPF